MSVAATLRELARFVEGCGGDVDGIEFPDGIDASGSRETTARIALRVSAVDASPSPRLDADGTLWLSSGISVPADAEVVETTLEGDAVRVVLSVPVGAAGPFADAAGSGGTTADGGATGSREAETEPTAGRPDGDASTADGSTGGSRIPWRDQGVPPFRDPELLAEVYDSCDTFAEMTDALGMDVTAETVRRYMIDHGIHEPDSYDTGGDDPGDGDDPVEADDDDSADVGDDAPTGADEDADREDGVGSVAGPEPIVVADGIGLPEDVTVETFIETVRRSNTIREVRRDVGVEREDALELLRELNLLDLVVGRMAVEGERDISREEIVGRLREASATN